MRIGERGEAGETERGFGPGTDQMDILRWRHSLLKSSTWLRRGSDVDVALCALHDSLSASMADTRQGPVRVCVCGGAGGGAGRRTVSPVPREVLFLDKCLCRIHVTIM